jgi:uncharacterized membrane protein YeiB
VTSSDPLDVYGEVIPWGPGPVPSADPFRLGSASSRGSDRIASIDSLRGLALLFMLGSHASLSWDAGVFPSGWGFFVFIFVSGSLWRPRPLLRARRFWQLVGAALLSFPLSAGLPNLNGFNILCAWVLVLPVLRLTRNWSPLWVATMGGAIWAEWGFAGLGGANPGLVILGWTIGRLVGVEGMREATRRLPSPRWLAWIGRWPLTVYVGHLVLLLCWHTLA